MATGRSGRVGEADSESPSSECLPRLQFLKDRGRAVDWHFYPGATHAGDQAELHNTVRTDWRGGRSTYLYSKEATADAGRRIFEFMEQHLAK